MTSIHILIKSFYSLLFCFSLSPKTRLTCKLSFTINLCSFKLILIVFASFLNCYIRHFTFIPPSTKVNKKVLPRMITLYIFVFSLFATCKVFILDTFRDFDYLYENNLQTKCKQFGLFSYLCKLL